jgi:hypothetical protein
MNNNWDGLVHGIERETAPPTAPVDAAVDKSSETP